MPALSNISKLPLSDLQRGSRLVTSTPTLELWVRPGYNIQACCTQAGPAQAAGHGDGMDRWQRCTSAAAYLLHW